MDKRYTILAVDDSKSNLEILMTHLNPKFDVIPALSGQKALEVVQKKKIDLILLDIMMPGMDGYEFCSRIKNNDRAKDIPVIFITAKTDEDAIERAYDAGGIDYVIKPFRPRELFARIRRELTLQQLILDLEASKEELKVLATTDPLTKLYNRRSFTEMSSHLLGQARRQKQDMSVLMMDVDRFKHINDTYGHDMGDQVLMTLAATVKDLLRKGDVICRYGGEEFVLLLPDTTIAGACALGEKIRQAVEGWRFKTETGQEVACTISIGAAQVEVHAEINLEPSLKRADLALYQAKARGRNQLARG